MGLTLSPLLGLVWVGFGGLFRRLGAEWPPVCVGGVSVDCGGSSSVVRFLVLNKCSF